MESNKYKLDPPEVKFEEVGWGKWKHKLIKRGEVIGHLTLFKVKLLVRENEEGQRSPILRISNFVCRFEKMFVLVKIKRDIFEDIHEKHSMNFWDSNMITNSNKTFSYS